MQNNADMKKIASDLISILKATPKLVLHLAFPFEFVNIVIREK